MSLCPISFQWKQILEPHVIQVEPSYGEIGILKKFFPKKFLFNIINSLPWWYFVPTYVICQFFT